MVDCPRCGHDNDIDWEPGSCERCGLGYQTDQIGETWSGDEYPIPIWDKFEPPTSSLPISLLVSWDPETLTDQQRNQFDIRMVGTSFHSGRSTFQVTCRYCGKVLHHGTNDPSNCIDQHTPECKRGQ